MIRFYSFLCMAFFLSPICLRAQTVWTTTGPFPSPMYAYTLAKGLGGTNVAVGGETGDQPQIYYSSDLGGNWIGTSPYLNKVVSSLCSAEFPQLNFFALLTTDPNSAEQTSLCSFTHSNQTWATKRSFPHARTVWANGDNVIVGGDGPDTATSGIWCSTNGGNTWAHPIHGTRIYCMETPLTNNNFVYAAGAAGSDDRGVILKSSPPYYFWEVLPVNLDGVILGITVTDSGNIFIAMHNGLVYRSLQGGAFELLNVDGVVIAWNLEVFRIPIVNDDLGHIFIGDDGRGVFMSTDNGTNWSSFNYSLTDLHIVDLRFNPYAKKLFAAHQSGVSSFLFCTTGVGNNVVDQQNEKHLYFGLDQNYPNPFNPATTIRYTLPRSVHVTLSVYDMLGEKIAVLVNEQQSAGYHATVFQDPGIASGLYFYRLQAGKLTDIRKMLLLK